MARITVAGLGTELGMAARRRDDDRAAEVEAALDELEVRFLLDPDTRFDDPRPAEPSQ